MSVERFQIYHLRSTCAYCEWASAPVLFMIDGQSKPSPVKSSHARARNIFLLRCVSELPNLNEPHIEASELNILELRFEQGDQLISSQQDFKAKQCDPFRLHEKIVLLNYIKIPRTTAMIFHVNFAQTHTHTHSHQGVNDAKNKCVDRSRFETHQNWPQGFGVSFAMVRKNKCTSYCQVTARITLRKSCFS